MKVFLTGFMAAGKSAVGKRLSRIAGVPFLDLDRDIEQRAGKRIPEIFTEGGESAFRELPRRNASDGTEEAIEKLLLGHFQRENADGFLLLDCNIARDVECECGFSHARATGQHREVA